MLVIRVVGGLGNQLFAYALYGYLKEKGKRVKLDTGFYDNQNLPLVDKREYELEKYFDIKAEYLNVFEKLIITAIRKTHNYDLIKYTDKGMGHEKEIDQLDWRELEGYWNTFLFAEQIKEKLIYTLDVSSRYAADPVMKSIEETNSVGIHVRRGDYLRLNWTVSNIYYKKAIEFISKAVDNPVYFCFSDDIAYCKEIFDGSRMIFVDNKGDLFDFCAMSCCKHNIVANSTFSAWSAWLNKNPEKIVIHPCKWYGSERTSVDSRLWPEKWIEIE